ncbi:MAG: excinuclease ABC subunit UvrA, partial [Deltaproteobacteria bacterium]|nr:excinuclease ABC subunit UvrA [Deltaproteobacteria bacterium]
MKDAIAIRGAREHNLADIDLDLPREKLIVITGPSGSGKSSLAFDTIYAEGQRRYVASLSVHARRFLDRFARPDVDAIEGLSPTISVPQGGLGRHRRSTVATVTELHDHLRLLFARVGQARCPNCGQALRRFSVPEISKALFDLPERARLIILSPVVRGQRGDFVTLLNDLRRDGFARVEVDGEVRELAEDLVIPEDRPHTLAIIVDRLLLKPSAKARLAESLELAMHRADGRVIVRWALGPAAASHDLFFASRLVCPACDRELPELTPSLFSFNSPKGACRRCGGLGRILDADPDRVVPDPGLSLSAGAIALWELRNAATYHARLTDLAAAMDFSLETPWVELSEDAREVILSGSGERMFRLRAEGRKGARRREMPFEGVLSDITRRHEALTREAREVGDQDESFDTLIDELEVFMSEAPCSACSGARLGPPALAVFLGGRTIAEVTALSVDAASLFFRDL